MGDSAGVSVLESTDAAEHASCFRGWNLQMDQVSSGRFSGRLVLIRLGDLEIARETTNQVLIKQGSSWPGSLVFSLPLAASSKGYFNGRPLVAPGVLLEDGADLPPLLTSRQLDVVSIAVARGRFANILERVGEKGAADFVTGNRLGHYSFKALPGELARLQHALREVCNVMENLEEAVAGGRARASLEEAIVDALVNILSSDSCSDTSIVTPQKKIVDGIREYVFAHVENPPSIADICSHVGLSRRTLQLCFREAVGLTPLQYLRALRLNAVHRELLTVARDGTPFSIGDVAARWGFWHWSRFTENYRILFGERPSQTVQRVLSAAR